MSETRTTCPYCGVGCGVVARSDGTGVSIEGDRALLRVRDNGVGMTEEVKQRCLEPFFSTKGERGTGLGLSMVYGIIERHRGRLNIDSVPGHGTTFTISLPIADAVKISPPVQQTANAGKSHLNILVVDDDPDVHSLLQRTLSRQGFQVVAARSGEEGLRLAKKLIPQVITLDVMMPGMDGWAVLAALKADPLVAEIPVIMLTIVDDRNIGYALGAADYLTKPVDWNRLVTILQRYRRDQHAHSLLVVGDDLVTPAG